MPEQEKSLIESFMRIASYREVFSQYEGYEHRVMPGTITALGEALDEAAAKLPSRSLFMVGIPAGIYRALWEGFRESNSFHLLDPIAASGFDLWVIAVPQESFRRVTWLVFPVTREDLMELRKSPVFSIVVVPISEQSFDELTERVDAVVAGIKQGAETPSPEGLLLLLDLTDLFAER